MVLRHTGHSSKSFHSDSHPGSDWLWSFCDKERLKWKINKYFSNVRRERYVGTLRKVLVSRIVISRIYSIEYRTLTYIRPAQFWGGFSRQTPSFSLTQNVTLYQFLGPYNIILPRHESFQIGQFILILALKWCTWKLSCHGKTIT